MQLYNILSFRPLLLLFLGAILSQCLSTMAHPSPNPPPIRPRQTTTLPTNPNDPSPYADFLTVADIPADLLGAASLLNRTTWKTSHLYPGAAAYSLYIPEKAFLDVYLANNETKAVEEKKQLPLVIAVHGTSRNAEQMRADLEGFATDRGVAVLAPMFWAGVGGGNDLDNYKNIHFTYDDHLNSSASKTLQYDNILFSILAEVAVRWQDTINTSRPYLTGFSGGGQFALRMWYLYPNRFAGFSAGAPGNVTKLDWEAEWPAGVKGVEYWENRVAQGVGGVDLEEVRAMKEVQLLVGAKDTDRTGDDLRDIISGGGEADGNGKQKLTRVQLIQDLHEELKGLGIETQLDIVPEAGHDSHLCSPALLSWLNRVISTSD